MKKFLCLIGLHNWFGWLRNDGAEGVTCAWCGKEVEHST